MKIFFAYSYYDRHKYRPYYQAVEKALKRQNSDFDTAERLLLKRNLKSTADSSGDPKALFYQKTQSGVNAAEAVIFDLSREDFRLGLLAKESLSAKKHILCLSIFENIAENAVDPYLSGAIYSEHTAREIISEFIQKIQKETLKERFNLFLSPGQLEYLEKTSRRAGMNKSEYLRRLLADDRQYRNV